MPFIISARIIRRYMKIISHLPERNTRLPPDLCTPFYGVPYLLALEGLLRSFILYRKVFVPIRRLAAGEGGSKSGKIQGDELVALRDRVKGLEDNVDETKSLLEESREHLMQTEKLALIGKLSAGVAHSVRNPLTSVKMRLFFSKGT